MLKIIIADGVGVIVAHNEVAFGSCDELSVCAAFRFGVNGSFAGPDVPCDESFDAFSQPELVYDVDVEPVSEVLLH